MNDEWDRVCATAKPGDRLRIENMTGQLIREGRVLHTVRLVAMPMPESEKREVHWSDWERQSNGMMMARELTPEEAAQRPTSARSAFPEWHTLK